MGGEPNLSNALAELILVLVTAAIVHFKTKKVDKKVETLDTKLTTNHGKTPAQYLEMIAELKTGQADNHAALVSGLAKLEAGLAEHTVSDAKNFALIMEALSGKQDK